MTPEKPHNPECATPAGYYAHPVWAIPRSLATTWGISVDFFSCRYLDVSVPCVRYQKPILFSNWLVGMTPHRFPYSEILGSKPACGSPGLFAACHVLHRLSVPRHPPCALHSLTKLKVCNRADYTLKYSRRCPAQLAVESQPDEHTLRYRIETRSVVSSIRVRSDCLEAL